MPGIGEEIEGAMQHAPQLGLQSMNGIQPRISRIFTDEFPIVLIGAIRGKKIDAQLVPFRACRDFRASRFARE